MESECVHVKKSWVALIMLVLVIPIYLNFDSLQLILQNDVAYFVEQELGYRLLLFTLPLSILQSIFTLFPFVTIVLIHVLTFGLWEGLMYSWIGSSLGAISCFILGRYFFQDYSRKIWAKKQDQYEKWVHIVNLYGLWGVVFLRSIPIIPSNIISLMAAFSPMKLNIYIWSTVIGNISMVWLFGVFSDAIIFADETTRILLGFYILFVVLLAIIASLHYRRKRKIAWNKERASRDSADR